MKSIEDNLKDEINKLKDKYKDKHPCNKCKHNNLLKDVPRMYNDTYLSFNCIGCKYAYKSKFELRQREGQT